LDLSLDEQAEEELEFEEETPETKEEAEGKEETVKVEEEHTEL
jgi:hypothetical protein